MDRPLCLFQAQYAGASHGCTVGKLKVVLQGNQVGIRWARVTWGNNNVHLPGSASGMRRCRSNRRCTTTSTPSGTSSSTARHGPDDCPGRRNARETIKSMSCKMHVTVRALTAGRGPAAATRQAVEHPQPNQLFGKSSCGLLQLLERSKADGKRSKAEVKFSKLNGFKNSMHADESCKPFFT